MPENGSIKQHKKPNIKNLKIHPAFFLIPSVVGILVFFVIPYIIMVYYSFLDNPIRKNFVGIDNYKAVIFNKAFQTAVNNTFLFTVFAVPMAVTMGLLLALLLDDKIPGRSFLRSSMLTPLMVPTASVVLIFQVLFDYNGVVNKYITARGIDRVDFLKSSYGMIVVVILFLWKNLGYIMVLFLAALGNVPEDSIEVAKLEGASAWQTFWHVKVRYLSPTIVFTTMLSMINSFKVFREIYLLTGEYPFGTMYMLQHYMNNTFASTDYQKLSTAAVYMSVVMVIIIGILLLAEHHFGKDFEES